MGDSIALESTGDGEHELLTRQRNFKPGAGFPVSETGDN